MISGPWQIALRNLKRNKRRNLATGVAVALGFAALIALGGFSSQIENHLRVYTLYGTRVGHINVYKAQGLERFSTKPLAYSLSEADVALISSVAAGMDNTELHGPQLIGAGLIGNGCRSMPFLASGLDPQLDRQLRQHAQIAKWAPNLKGLSKGRGLWEYPEDVGAVAIADGLARILGKTRVFEDLAAGHKPVMVTDCLSNDAKDKIAADTNVQLIAGGWSGMMTALDGEVVANFNSGVTETNYAALQTSLTLLQKLYDTKNATYYSIWLKDPGQLSQDLRAVAEALRRSGGAFDLYPWTDEAIAPFYTGTVQFLLVMVSFITVVLAAVVIFSVFNAATMTVIERSQEIGMMRSLGFKRNQVRQLFVMEMVLLVLIAVAVGGLLAASGILAVNQSRILIHPPGIAGGMELKLSPTPEIVGLAAALIFTLAVSTTLLAVWKVAKRNIAGLLMGTQR